MKEEVFGPVLPIFKFSTFDEAISLANDSQYGLGASVWTRGSRQGNEGSQQNCCRDNMGKFISRAADRSALWRTKGKRPWKGDGFRGTRELSRNEIRGGESTRKEEALARLVDVY